MCAAKRIVLGLSDGVDSAVSALLLKKQGYEVLGVHLQLGGNEGLESARTSAREAGISFETADIRPQLDRYVVQPFISEYLRGRTPSPCPGCNRDVKLPALFAIADRLGVDEIATGHYVLKRGERLFMGQADCDQSYMLVLLRPSQVKRLVLPLGGMSKTEVRAYADAARLSCAEKPDSRENCFVHGEHYAEYIRERCSGSLPGKGDVLYMGKTIDTHEGIYRYTVGQRWKADIGERRAYVAGIDAEKNTISLALWEELFTHKVILENVTFLYPDHPDYEFEARIRVRHTRWETPLCRVQLKNGEACVTTQTPLRAPAPGQTAALYADNMLLGGGTVREALRDDHSVN